MIRSIDELALHLYQEEEAAKLEQSNRPQLRHFIHKLVWNGITSKIVALMLKEGKNRVLDVGCSPGAWILDMAVEYPDSVFVGIDIDPTFPNEGKPSNAAFIECNVLDGIPFPENTFDCVHQSGMLSTYTGSQWGIVLREMVRVIKPGGYLEIAELDFNYKNVGPMTKKLMAACWTNLESKGVKCSVLPYLDGYLKDISSIPDLKWEDKPVPIGSWGGNLGESVLKSHTFVFRSLASTLAPRLEISLTDYEKLLDRLPAEFTKYRTSCTYFRAYAKKIPSNQPSTGGNNNGVKKS
ncbi:hypothetical protein G9A89_007273 [Geosiphon pyriformis]|nr:hypothetical protein G9A89_007273 [Geosiphon pyriformis]